jgi:hypothetical protein
MARIEDWPDGQEPNRYEIKIEKLSDTVRIYSSPNLKDEYASLVELDLVKDPEIKSVRAIVGEPEIRFEVVVHDPEVWNIAIDSECQDAIRMALQAQDFLS